MRGTRRSILAGLALMLALAAGLWMEAPRPPGAETQSRTENDDRAPPVSAPPVTASVASGRAESALNAPEPIDPSEPTPDSPASAADPLLQAGLSPSESLRRLERCGQLTSAVPAARFEDAWRWLGEEAARLERARFAQARAWLVDRCGPWTLAPGSDRAQHLTAELTRRAAQSSDLSDQLRTLEHAKGAPSAADAVAARRQLEAALATGRPELVRDIGRVLARSPYAAPELLGPYAGAGASGLFTLLACDLGMPCGADSELVRLSCALSGFCGYTDYEALVFDALLGARAGQLLQQHRALLLARIRTGQVQGLFDPIPLPPKP